MSDRATTARRGWLGTFLYVVERGGNMLPHPATLFLIFALVIIVLSDLAARAGLAVEHPGTHKMIEPVSLLTVAGLHRILQEMVVNFTKFAPLGTVLVALLGISVAESSGLIGAVMRLLVTSAPRSLLTIVVVFAGVLSNAASEIGYVLLVPLSGMIFQAAGRHPVAGLAAGFAGVSGGYSANLLLGTIDPLLAGLTEEAARIVKPDAEVNPACNYFFMFASTFLVTALGAWVTERVTVPRLGRWSGDGDPQAAAPPTEELRSLTTAERRGLVFALLTALAIVAVLLLGTVPESGFLRGPDGDLLRSPFMRSIVAIIFLSGALCGLAYGVAARTIRNDADVMKGMGKAMSTLGEYLVLVFFAAQFVAYFDWTNLGLILAVKGADLLQSSQLGAVPLMLALVLLSAVINLFLGSASAKWAVMAPVFVPMLMILGYDPALVQAAYRIGDSCTNIITPMMSYFPLIIAFFRRYDRGAGIGTLVATMLPYTITFMIGWSALLTLWMWLGLPLGF
ncbi:MAG: AbgT family transporter [Phycisphaerae bacterium]|jgi:aminobenzoyl-glutamate transport protein|nr:AbgT family transporter [Phycisphaerae bacterium]MCZ2401500.1 AbgT family transporter [Phycisphaerae bacterium]NUQ50567.1 AbgT family transporter [Phycisphaerae bacterium]